MPYIPEDRRMGIDLELGADSLTWCPSCAGDLNFVVSVFIANYIAERGLSYAALNEMVGALECAKMELNRVVIGPYEDVKIAQNGPVYAEIKPAGQY